MTARNNLRKGTVKTTWSEVRKSVLKVAPNFAKIVDEIDPNKSFPLFLAYYPYGELIGDTYSPFIPAGNGKFYRLSDPSAPKEISTHLGYGKDSLPLGLVLEKQLEYFIDLKEERITIPWLIYPPGTFFPFSRILSKNNNRVYASNGILLTSSGSRSAFMLPNIGCTTNHSNLQRHYNVKSPAPKTLYEHWNIFKEITRSPIASCSWYTCLLFFSEIWINKLYTDPAWTKLKFYLYELAWYEYEFRRNYIYYDIAFSIIQKKRNLKPNPYLADTAKHLYSIVLGGAPGFSPACNNDALPLDVLQNAFVESYGLKKYHPTIIHPKHFSFETDKLPIYYSLQNPSTFIFSPKSRKISSTLFEMRELEHIIRVFTEELANNGGLCSDAIISKAAKDVSFSFFHNEVDRHKIIKSTKDILKLDKRFLFSKTHDVKSSQFASDAKFMRGCIAIKTDN